MRDSVHKRSHCTPPHKTLSSDLLAFLELIREAGSEAKLERRASLHTGTLSHYSRSLRPSEPSRHHLVAIADAAGVRLAWLAAGKGSKRNGDG